MKINTALILCAGFGKRLNPLTLNTPKPLLEINNLTLLENTINLIQNLGIKKIAKILTDKSARNGPVSIENGSKISIKLFADIM